MNNPLVSICVITYNSSKTIIQTLDSVKIQTYQNFELIISDDGSTDDTVEICNSWIEQNRKLNFRLRLITIEYNTGVPSNCNRAIEACKGKWIKLIAGDDCLMKNCISDFINYINTNRTCEIVFSNYYLFIEKSKKIELKGLKFIDEQMLCFSDMNAKEQLHYYIEHAINITPSLFYTKKLLLKHGGFDERYRLFEDTPMIVKLLNSNVHIEYMSIPTVLYRISQESITRMSDNKYFYKTSFIDCALQFKQEQIWPLFNWYNILFWIKEFSFIVQYKFTTIVLNNKRNKNTELIYNLFKMLNLYYSLSYLKKKLK